MACHQTGDKPLHETDDDPVLWHSMSLLDHNEVIPEEAAGMSLNQLKHFPKHYTQQTKLDKLERPFWEYPPQ